MKRFLSWLSVLVVAALVAACGGKAQPAQAPATPSAPAASGGQAAPAAQQAKPPKAAEMVGPRTTDRAKATAQLALYNGADRTQKLVDGAKAGRETSVNMYTSLTEGEWHIIKPAFEKYLKEKFGITAELVIWQGKGEEVTQKAAAEAKANRYDVDLLESDSVELEKISREGITDPFWTPAFDVLNEKLRSTKWLWAGARINYFVPAYNTKLMKPEELPKTWQDLLKPEYKGKITVEATDVDWFSALVNGPLGGQAKGVDFFKQIKSTQGIQNRKGHTLLTNLVSAGEVPLALNVFSSEAQRQKDKGAPIEWFTLDPIPGRANGVSLVANAKSPNLALLFIDWYLSEPGQSELAKAHTVVVNPKVETDPPRMSKGFTPLYIDSEWLVDNMEQWQKIWDQTVIGLK